MINIAILGFGNIGSGTAEFLSRNAEIIERKTGEKIYVKRILDLRKFEGTQYESRVTSNIDDIVNDPEISVVAEMMGGSHPAYEYTMKALCSGKSVVTSNKEVVSKFGVEFLRTAEAHGVRYLFEASVGGGIPVLRPMTDDLSGNEITEINGILNGTTNYILTQMFGFGKSFDEALAEAKQKGYAEADPTDDVMGKDACRKICILSAIAYGKSVLPDTVSTEGITGITSDDVAHAEKYGASIKLLGHSVKFPDGRFSLMVAPFVVGNSSPIAHVNDVFNGVMVHGNLVGDVFFYGRGAGKEPTASAVVSDIIDIVTHLGKKVRTALWEPAEEAQICPVSECSFRYMLSLDCSSFDAVKELFDGCETVCDNGEIVIVTSEIKECILEEKLLSLKARGISVKSKIRVL